MEGLEFRGALQLGRTVMRMKLFGNRWNRKNKLLFLNRTDFICAFLSQIQFMVS